MPTKEDQNATLWKDKDYTIEFTEADEENLTNFNTIKYVFSTSKTASSVVFSKTKSGGGISVTGSNNEVAEVTIDRTDIADLDDYREYYHELMLEDSSGKRQAAAEGQVEIRPSQT